MTGSALPGVPSGAARLAGVVGWPVDHSLSPAIHNYWIRKCGLDAAYVPLPVQPGHLETAIRALPAMGFRGCNVTVPHKVDVRAFLDDETEQARLVGAVNTVFVDGERLLGANTDVGGFLGGLGDQAPGWERSEAKTVVVGAGGAARAVVAGLRSALAGEIVVANRTLGKAEEIASRFKDVRAESVGRLEAELQHAGLLVNTTTLGMRNAPDLDPDLAGLRDDAVVVDIVYAPLVTALLRSAGRRGLTTVDGLGMLLHQAVGGFEGWFGIRPEVDQDVRAHVLAALDA